MSFIYDGHCDMHKNHSFTCNECSRDFGPYKNAGVANRMASNHVVTMHKDKLPAKAEKPKRAYSKRVSPTSSTRSLIGVNYCPGCGCNLAAVRVAMGM